MRELVWICLGGAVGSGARHLVSGWSARMLGAAFPFGTLAVNVLGSFMLGAVVFLGVEAKALSSEARLFLATGVLGGFTTYSTFNYETLKLLREGSMWTGVLYLGATVVSCLLAGAAGMVLAKVLVKVG